MSKLAQALFKHPDPRLQAEDGVWGKHSVGCCGSETKCRWMHGRGEGCELLPQRSGKQNYAGCSLKCAWTRGRALVGIASRQQGPTGWLVGSCEA